MADTQQEQPKKPKPPQDAPKAKVAKGPKEGGKDGGAPKVKKPRVASDYKARLRLEFEQTIRAALTKQFNYKNRMQVPMITKVVLNMGIGEGVADRKKADSAAADLVAYNCADQAVGAGNNSAHAGGCAAPCHRSSLAIPVRRGDEVVAVADKGDAAAADGVARIRPDQTVG